MPRDRRDVVRSLKTKGFIEHSGDHEYYTYHTLDGKKTRIRTKVSHGTKYKELSDSLIGQMARQVNLSKSEFLKFVDCTLDQTKYEKIAYKP